MTAIEMFLQDTKKHYEKDQKYHTDSIDSSRSPILVGNEYAHQSEIFLFLAIGILKCSPIITLNIKRSDIFISKFGIIDCKMIIITI